MKIIFILLILSYGQLPIILSYDYVVLGAGTAGSVVASKLSDKGSNTVLLVEEGPWALNPDIYNAVGWGGNWLGGNVKDRVVSKAFRSEPQVNMFNRTFRDLRAKVVGGCNAHNAMVVVAGTPTDFDEWANTTGENAWAYANHKVNFRDIDEKFDLTYLSKEREFLPEMKQALENLGYRFNPYIYQTGAQPGSFATRIFMWTKDGTVDPPTYRRQTTYTQYVENQLASKPNLDVMANEKALYLNYGRDSKGKQYVKGVLIQNTGTKRFTYVSAKKEIIISMGAYESPKFLQLNGIGSRKLLQKLGIQPVVDAPGVGENLKDQLYMLLKGKPLSDKYANRTFEERSPISDGFHIFGPTHNNLVEYILAADISNGYFTCTLENTKVKSQGYVQIRSSNPRDDPIINERTLDEKYDLDTYMASAKECRRIQEELVKMGVLKEFGEVTLANINTDEELAKLIRKTAAADYHACCTVRMGSDSDPLAPLDSHLRVRGIENLRVIDASIFPTSISGNPNMPIASAAMLGAKFILEEDN
eukprot:gene4222-5286_t